MYMVISHGLRLLSSSSSPSSAVKFRYASTLIDEGPSTVSRTQTVWYQGVGVVTMDGGAAGVVVVTQSRWCWPASTPN